MKKLVQFQTENFAQQIAEYFPSAELNGDRLFFSQFDEWAFNLAASLEKIDKSTYYYVIGKILIEVQTSDKLCSFELTVKANVKGKVVSEGGDGRISTSGYDDYSLVINSELFVLLASVFKESYYPCCYPIKYVLESEIDHAAFIIRMQDSFFDYFLFVRSKFRTGTFPFAPKTMIKSFSFEEI
jgi:hypothetical protein